MDCSLTNEPTNRRRAEEEDEETHTLFLIKSLRWKYGEFFIGISISFVDLCV